jgi:TolB-like protein
MMTHIPPYRPSASALAAALALAAFALAALAPPAAAQQQALSDAREAYQFAEYTRAVDLFASVARDETAPVDAREEAYRYLGRIHVVQDQPDAARTAISEMLRLEPTPDEPNPDIEPPQLMRLYYEVSKEMGGYGVQQDPGLQTLAVMDFANNSVDERDRFEGLAKGLPAIMINSLNGATDMKVVERERISWLLDELELQRNGNVVDQATAVRAGKLLGVNAVVFGSMIVFEDDMSLSARVVKVETGEVLLGEQIRGKSDDFFELIDELSTKVATALNVEIEDQIQTGATETKSLDAMMAYSDGLDLLEDGLYTEAHEKFLEALEYDSSFERAEIKAESIRPLVLTADSGESSGTTRTNR